MIDKELKYWQEVTNISTSQWVQDDVISANGRGHLFYIGGETGHYMRISPDGNLEIGAYEGALPHIGEATFKPKAKHKYDNINDAFKTACSIGGKQFVTDMFKNNIPQFSNTEDKEIEYDQEPGDGIQENIMGEITM